MKRGVTVLLCVALGVTTARMASAQPACDATRAVALEAAGMEAFREARYDDAYTHLVAAYEACHGARAQVRVGSVLMELGRWVEADRWMREALARTDDPWVVSRRAGIVQQLTVIAQHLPVQRSAPDVDASVATPGVSDAAVAVADVVVDSAPRDVAVAAPDVGVRDERVETRGNATTFRVLGGVSAALALASAGVGTWATVVRFDRRGGYDGTCSFDPRDARCNALYDNVIDPGMWAVQVVGFVMTGALAVTSAVLFAMAPSREATLRQAFGCGFGPGAIGIGCGGRF
jgi:hypothetical protein